MVHLPFQHTLHLYDHLGDNAFYHSRKDAARHSSYTENLVWCAWQENGSIFKSLLLEMFHQNTFCALEAQGKICNQKSLIKVN